MFTFWLLGLGAGSVAYGLRGERIPGKFVTLINNDSDNGLQFSERAFWIASGICGFALGLVQLAARYKAV